MHIGNSKNVLKNPINSIKWMANQLAKKNIYVPKNYYISTGTCTPATPINEGDKIIADFNDIGLIRFNYI